MIAVPARSTQQLASAPLQLVYGGRWRDRPWRVAAVAALAVPLLGAILHYTQVSSPAARLAAAEAGNLALEAELARLRAELEIERATRAALDGQVAELNEQLGELTRQINFVNAQGNRPRATRPAAPAAAE